MLSVIVSLSICIIVAIAVTKFMNAMVFNEPGPDRYRENLYDGKKYIDPRSRRR
jgi:hypothetical protein